MSAKIRTINIYLFITLLLPSVVGPGCTEGSYGKIINKTYLSKRFLCSLSLRDTDTTN